MPDTAPSTGPVRPGPTGPMRALVGLKRFLPPPSVGLQRGLSNSVQWAVLFPAVLLCTLGIIQAGVWVHGRNVAIEAANTAADLSRSLGADDGAAQSAAQRIAAVGGLSDVNLRIERGATEVNVTFTGRIPMFFDVGLGAITEQAHAPVERVTTP